MWPGPSPPQSGSAEYEPSPPSEALERKSTLPPGSAEPGVAKLEAPPSNSASRRSIAGGSRRLRAATRAAVALASAR